MGPILLFINLFLLFIIESKITFVNHLAKFVGNIHFYCLLFNCEYHTWVAMHLGWGGGGFGRGTVLRHLQ